MGSRPRRARIFLLPGQTQFSVVFSPNSPFPDLHFILALTTKLQRGVNRAVSSLHSELHEVKDGAFTRDIQPGGWEA